MVPVATAGEVHWDASLRRSKIEIVPSAAVGDEIRGFATGTSLDIPIGTVPVHSPSLPSLLRDVESWRPRIERARLALVRPVAGLDFRGRRLFAWTVANLLGEPLVQNAEGDRLIAVYARPGNRRVIDGARYHQSREGGGPHTDNVSTPDTWEYMVFSCIRGAAIGGESILIDGIAIERELARVPRARKILQQPFWWEYRGISDGVYAAPILTYDESGQPHFRYLRKYLESAHRRAGHELSDEQAWALDVLDALLDRADLQFRTSLAEGEILVTMDSQVFHARTAFADESPGGPADLGEAASGNWRFFDRVWIRKST